MLWSVGATVPVQCCGSETSFRAVTGDAQRASGPLGKR